MTNPREANSCGKNQKGGASLGELHKGNVVNMDALCSFFVSLPSRYLPFFDI